MGTLKLKLFCGIKCELIAINDTNSKHTLSNKNVLITATYLFVFVWILISYDKYISVS